MRVIIVKDDVLPDKLFDAVSDYDWPSTVRQVCLTEFIRENGYVFDSEAGRFQPLPYRVEQDRSLVIDRVIQISRETRNNLADNGIEPSRGQVSEAYAALLKRNLQPCPIHSLYSTVGMLVPLFTQWSMVKSKLPMIAVPRYKYGYGPEVVDASDFAQPIHTTPFHLYEWKPNAPMSERPDDVFIIDRPEGLPLVAYFCDDLHGMQWLGIDEPVSEQLRMRISEALAAICEVFTGFAGETLWFVEGSVITFAAFSYAVNAAHDYPDFRRIAYTALTQLEAKYSSEEPDLAVRSQ